jgi:methanogenic corrinoid protein MtbC1
MGGGRPSDSCDDARSARISALGDTYARAVLAGDEVEAELVVRDAIDTGLTMAEVDDEIIAPALWLVGELWARGEISVADEHLATEISLRVLTLQREVRRLAAERRHCRVMLAAPSGEHHVVALRMIEHLLRESGYGVIMLGPDVPPRALATAALRHAPDVICLSATMPGGGDRVLIGAAEVLERMPGARFVVGGRALTSHVRSRPGMMICPRVAEVVESVDAAVKRADLN